MKITGLGIEVNEAYVIERAAIWRNPIWRHATRASRRGEHVSVPTHSSFGNPS